MSGDYTKTAKCVIFVSDCFSLHVDMKFFKYNIQTKEELQLYSKPIRSTSQN